MTRDDPNKKISFNLEMTPNLYALATARINSTNVRLILEGVYHMIGGFNVWFVTKPSVIRQRRPQLGDMTTVTVRTEYQRDAVRIAGHERSFAQPIVQHLKTNTGLLYQAHNYMEQLLMLNLKNTWNYMRN